MIRPRTCLSSTITHNIHVIVVWWQFDWNHFLVKLLYVPH